MPIDMSKFAGLEPVDQSEAYTSSDEIAARFHDQVAGKIILITGVSPNSLGAACALSLATASPTLLILASRNLCTVHETISDVKEVNPRVRTRALELNLASLPQVTHAAKSLADVPRIDVLINNAGIMGYDYATTIDGFESHFGVNYVGHFQLTRVLLPKLQAGEGGGRVVNVASRGHRLGPVRWDDMGFGDGERYDKWDAYGQSKTAVILHALALVEKGLVKKAFAAHPGETETNLMRGPAKGEIEELLKGAKIMLKTPKQGASTILRAALDPSLDGFAYLEDCQIAKPADHASNPEYGERLWKVTEELVDARI